MTLFELMLVRVALGLLVVVVVEVVQTEFSLYGNPLFVISLVRVRVR
jgi:hypothetical protein